MTVATWTIINNEIDYIQDIVEYHLPFIDYMYFLDTGSNDGTYEYLLDLSKSNSKIILEKYHTSFTPDLSNPWEKMQNPFPEVDVRNFAIQQVEKLNTDWLIQLDGDEIFLSNIIKIIQEKKDFEVISHSTINPVCKLQDHPIEIRNGIKMYDPHARVWRANRGFKYMKNPAMKQQYHCIPVFDNKHLYHHPKNVFISDIIHMHLHWMYGKKVEKFFSNISKNEIIKNQPINEFSVFLPYKFWQRRKQWVNK